MSDALKVALLGCGTVGGAVLRLLSEQSDDLAARVGRRIEVAGVAVRRPDRHPEVPADLLTTDAHALVTRPDVDLVVEVIGGIEPARSLLLAAIGAGKSVVSANKALLADDGVALHAAASEAGVDLYYEAAVAGAIPLLRPLRESLAGDQLRRVVGIVNGTTNYILSRMAETGAGFGEALAEATELGYAEADPTADVDGFDAAAKAAILASLAFHSPVTAADVHREGISAVSATDVARAAEIGCTVKLLAICERVTGADGADDGVAVRVHPAMIPTTHPLAAVGGAFNAVFVEAEAAGELMFYGRGAGGEPTASAVLGDLVAVARNRLAGAAGPGTTGYAGLTVRPMADTPTRYHVSLDVADVPGVLATVAQEFAAHGVSIATVRQDGHGDAATLVIVTHRAPDSALAATVSRLREMSAVRGVTSVLRVEGLS
ncbi:homoserine dehydrogenase [Modestobacter versicolor]|uniref:Homoserine dehydrogenase n=1 Tax=Modestobacter versicolor TaxID=429133 RepID=A0A323V9T8_9ACTN|nr:homoserine dehydrogenase [Modestobacter versicolor]MBB3678562.1 homoserine dehydrogenase [Modestobacter versicolor]PZA21519.1 homoserine dehydrogenase [Modestobacter versicolor]